MKFICLEKKIGWDWKLYFKLYRLIKKEKPQIIHSHLRALLYLLFAVFCMHSEISFFHTIHSDALKETGGKLLYIIKKFLFRFGWIVPITISDISQKSFDALYKLPSELIYNGRNIVPIKNIHESVRKEMQSFRITSHTKIFLNVGRLVKAKNQLALCHVVSRFIEEGKDIVLVVIGEGDEPAISSFVQEHPCSRIHFIGTRSRIREYMSLADAFCLSSLWEGMPITLIEALSVGAFPICTPVGGITDIIMDGVTGLLASDTSEEALRMALERFLNMTTDEKEHIKKNVLSMSKRFTIEICAQHYLSVMKNRV